MQVPGRRRRRISSPSRRSTLSTPPCKLCKNPTGPGPLATMENCKHTFHYQCLLHHFEVAVTAGQPATCPDCEGAANRPRQVAAATGSATQPQAIGGPDETVDESRVWDWVHYKLQLARDREAKALSYRPGGYMRPADISRQELYPLQAQTNYFEMVNACWMCAQLIGNEYWVTLPACQHVFHTFCLVDKFHAGSTKLRESGLWPETYKCPLCEIEDATPAPSSLVPSDTELTAKCSNHLREMRMEAAWFCARFRFLREREEQLHQPSAKRPDSRGPDEESPDEDRAVRTHLTPFTW